MNSTILKTRISQQEVQTPVVTADVVAVAELNTPIIQSRDIFSEDINSEFIHANKIDSTLLNSNKIVSKETTAQNIIVHNDVDARGDVLVSSGNVFVAKGRNCFIRR